MKKILFAILLSSSMGLLASETCYKVSKQGIEAGSLCLEKNLKEVEVGESVEVRGSMDNINIDFSYVRLQDVEYQGCIKPKDRPPVCNLVRKASLILPKPPLNKIGLPSVPANLTFKLPDLTTGEAWGYDLTLITN